MFRKSGYILIFSFLFFTKGQTQNFMHGAGVNFFFMANKTAVSPGIYNNNLLFFTNLTYFPKFTLTESENSSVSVGIPLGAGIGLVRDGGGDYGSVYYGFDFPLVIDYNMGCKATAEMDEGFGWYIGAGFGYTLTNWTDGSSTEKSNSYGPLLRSGVRFGLNDDRHPERALTIALFFKPGLEKAKFKTYGIGVITEF